VGWGGGWGVGWGVWVELNLSVGNLVNAFENQDEIARQFGSGSHPAVVPVTKMHTTMVN
jgi:hypothetical protein